MNYVYFNVYFMVIYVYKLNKRVGFLFFYFKQLLYIV